MSNFLRKELSYVKGIGPKKAEVLQSELGLKYLQDLLYYFPYRYVDRSQFHTTRETFSEQTFVQITGTITHIHTVGEGRKQRLEANFQDAYGSVKLVWFQGAKYMQENLNIGTQYVMFAKPKLFNGAASFVHPQLDTLESFQKTDSQTLEGQYLTTEKMKKFYLNSKALLKIIKNILAEHTHEIQETLDYNFYHQHNLMPLKEALLNIHTPKNQNLLDKARFRLKFEELFYLQLKLLLQKNNNKYIYTGHKFETVGKWFNTFYDKQLPFELTNAQKRVIREVRTDCNTGKQMNRLVQGDVGSGKTLVALMSMLLAIDNGFQACLMAPTEILATQHFHSITKMLGELGVQIDLLTGSTKRKHRNIIHENLRSGHTHILIGTHALLEDEVKFQNLGLAVIDEQHRFGVKQRSRLWAKNTVIPHVLVMTATPIPRTLAMTLYGELDVSVIDELPPGRQSIDTHHVFENSALRIIGFIKKQIAKGEQVYIVYPLIQESEKIDLKALEEGYERLVSYLPPPEYRIAAMHGKMKPEEKEKTMKHFKDKQFDILVSTTVIEVGVDVPNATTIIIEDANRFGLSQLHQLRGRVGRGSKKSTCILVTPYKLSQDSKKRMQAMCDTQDGFQLAEVDLKLRGPGDLEGTQQSGLNLDLKIANLSLDGELMSLTRRAVQELLDKDPYLIQPENLSFKNRLKELYQQQVDWGMIS